MINSKRKIGKKKKKEKNLKEIKSKIISNFFEK